MPAARNNNLPALRGNIPQGIRRKIEFLPDGRPRAPAKIIWFYRYLEHGDMVKAAEEAGYKAKQMSRLAWEMKQEFTPLLLDAMKYQGVGDLPVARGVLLSAMRNYDPGATVEVEKTDRDGNTTTMTVADPNKAASPAGMLAIKAAEIYMDRFGLPKTERHEFGGEEDVAADFRLLIDRMVATVGLDSVRSMAIMDHREYRDYLELKFGRLKRVEEPKRVPGKILAKMPVVYPDGESGELQWRPDWVPEDAVNWNEGEGGRVFTRDEQNWEVVE